jgi:capsular polysaccharide biosynthesis protein
MSWLRKKLHLPANSPFDPLSPGASASARIIPLDPGATFERPMPHLPSAPATAVTFFASRIHETTAPTYVAEFQEGIAWGHPTGGVFTAEGQFAAAFTHDPSGAQQHTVWTRLRFPKPRHLAGKTLYLVTPEATDNFHHWLIDLLPRLGLVRRAGHDLSSFDHVIVNHASRRYQLGTLAQLGISAEKLIVASDALFVRCDLLVVPSLKQNHQTIPAADITFLREAFLPTPPPVEKTRRIFLSRHDAAFRRLRNEAELQELLRAHDFEIISPGALDLTAQARLFSEAAVIAGPAGAAFANLVFASAPAQVIEIVPPQWLSAFHWMISARAGLSHTVVLGEGPVMRGVPDSSARQADISIEPERLAAALDEIAVSAKS